MKTRCYNTNNYHHKNWGAKGVSVCDEWLHNFKAFYDWAMANGYADNLTLDRIDSDGIYEPSNCRWVTNAVNCRNRENVIRIYYNGRSLAIGQWADDLGIPKATIYGRTRKGWSEIESLFGKLNMEQKQRILDLLLPVINSTGAGEEVKRLTYDDSNNSVILEFVTGFIRRIKLVGDSGITMISEIVNYLSK